MARRKRASMREGPLADLFRSTEQPDDPPEPPPRPEPRPERPNGQANDKMLMKPGVESFDIRMPDASRRIEINAPSCRPHGVDQFFR